MGGHVLAIRLRGSHPVSRIPQGGALRLSSKRSSRKRQTGAKPPLRENAQRCKDYSTQARARKWVRRDARRMCACMGNTVYAIRCVCLCILCSGGHTGFVSLFIQDKNRERSEPKQAARETSTLLWGKEKSTNKDREQSEHLIKKSKEYDIFLT